MDLKRRNKYEVEIKKIISQFLSQERKEIHSQFGMVSIQKVIISKDLSYMDILVSCFQNKDELTKTLAAEAPAMNKNILKGLSIRKLPRLRFRYDDELENEIRILDTLSKIRQ